MLHISTGYFQKSHSNSPLKKISMPERESSFKLNASKLLQKWEVSETETTESDKFKPDLIFLPNQNQRNSEQIEKVLSNITKPTHVPKNASVELYLTPELPQYSSMKEIRQSDQKIIRSKKKQVTFNMYKDVHYFSKEENNSFSPPSIEIISPKKELKRKPQKFEDIMKQLLTPPKITK